MRYSVDVPNFGEFADPEVVAKVARRAEEAGWDALLVWDHVVEQKDLRREIADPWILLTAAALATRRIRLGTAITPVARRRPAKLAREVTTLDRLTGGRMVLGVGLGAPVDDEYGSFGDTTDTKLLAERLDEGLQALDLLWSGEPVTYRGNQITIDEVVFLPTPVQRPRVPIWVGGVWPNKAPMRRAARWDGAIPAMAGTIETARPPEVREVRELVGVGPWPSSESPGGTSGCPGVLTWSVPRRSGAGSTTARLASSRAPPRRRWRCRVRSIRDPAVPGGCHGRTKTVE